VIKQKISDIHLNVTGPCPAVGLPDLLVIRTNYPTHTPSVQRTGAGASLFEIKLSSGKLVM
jgi:hypothetical protein